MLWDTDFPMIERKLKVLLRHTAYGSSLSQIGLSLYKQNQEINAISCYQMIFHNGQEIIEF
jgi:hypothetical protein